MSKPKRIQDTVAELRPGGEIRIAGSGGTTRRTFLKAAGTTAAGVGLMGIIAACGESKGTPSSAGGGGAGGESASLTLKMPLPEDIGVPDPDIAYLALGVTVMDALYEGLLRYETGTRNIIPSQAKSWSVSPDGLTYTFKLQPNVKFHDGTPVDSKAWEQSFLRRRGVGEGPSYMVEGVTKMETPDPTTFVVHLKTPNLAFPHYLACAFQPFATSPTAIKKNEKGGDLAQAWLKTHDAGSGPYQIKEFVPGSHYTLERFQDYWEGAPHFDTIRIEIVPSISTQKLELDQGEFDLVTVGLPIQEVKQYETKSEFDVTTNGGGLGVGVFMNESGGVFADEALRQATFKAIDRSSIVDTAWGGLAEAQTALWPPLVLDPKLAPIPTKVETEPAKSLVAKAPSKKLELVWEEAGGAPYEQAAGLLQLQLSELGFDVTVRPVNDAVIFTYPESPSKRPDMLLVVFGGDALQLDTVVRTLFRTKAVLNFFGYSDRRLDSLMDEAIEQGSEAKAGPYYEKCSQILTEAAIVMPLCVQPSSIVSHSYISGIEPNSYAPQNFWPPAITSS